AGGLPHLLRTSIEGLAELLLHLIANRHVRCVFSRGVRYVASPLLRVEHSTIISGWLNRLRIVVIALTVCHNIIPYRSISLLFADETAPAKCIHPEHRPVCTS